jgi:metal-responsive CopG/Arc/MetJ family transcriptional regulator
MASRNISISLPEEMIRQASQIAAQEHRTLSELFREAFRVYRSQQVKRALDEASQFPQTPDRSSRREQELARITKEIRAELEREE